MVSMEVEAKDLDGVSDGDLGGVKLERGKGIENYKAGFSWRDAETFSGPVRLR